MTNIRSITHSDLIREAKRRGLDVRRPQVELTPCESAAITLLVAAADALQSGDIWGGEKLAHKAFMATGDGTWLERFARTCYMDFGIWCGEPSDD